MCVNNLSKVAFDSAAAGIEPATFQSQVQCPTTVPPSHTTCMLQISVPDTLQCPNHNRLYKNFMIIFNILQAYISSYHLFQ